MARAQGAGHRPVVPGQCGLDPRARLRTARGRGAEGAHGARGALRGREQGRERAAPLAGELRYRRACGARRVDHRARIQAVTTWRSSDPSSDSGSAASASSPRPRREAAWSRRSRRTESTPRASCSSYSEEAKTMTTKQLPQPLKWPTKAALEQWMRDNKILERALERAGVKQRPPRQPPAAP